MNIISLLKYFPFFWLLGLHLPLLYIFFIQNVGKLFKKDLYLILGSIFIFFQLFSIYLSCFNEYFDVIRIIASLHNSFVYLFLLLGYSISYNYYNQDINKVLTSFILILMSLSLFSVIYYFYINHEFSYGILGLDIQFFRTGWLSDFAYPRLLIFSSYPNGVGILSFLLFSLYLYSSTKIYSIKNFIIGILFLILIFFTGSRIIMLLSLIMIVLLFIDKQWKYYNFIFIILLATLLSFYFGLFDLFMGARENSNAMRSLIYYLSIQTWLDTNVLFGIGIKPYIEAIPNYPLGSHSTLIGSLLKFGLVGGSIFIFFYIFLLLSSLIKFANLLLINNFHQKSLLITFTLISLLIIYLVEDIDALELNALLTGIVIGLFKQDLNIKNRSIM